MPPTTRPMNARPMLCVIASPYTVPTTPSPSSPTPFAASTRSGVQLPGFPAMSRRCWRAAAVPAGESRRPIARSHPGEESAARRERARPGEICEYPSSMTASARAAPRSGRAGATEITSSAMAMVSAPTAAPSNVVPVISHLDLDQGAHPERAYDDEGDSARQHHQPDCRRIEQLHIGPAAVEQPAAEQDGQRYEDVGRQPSFCAEGLDVPPEKRAFTHRRDGVAEHLGQVAADRALDPYRHDRPAHVLGVH